MVYARAGIRIETSIYLSQKSHFFSVVVVVVVCSLVDFGVYRKIIRRNNN